MIDGSTFKWLGLILVGSLLPLSSLAEEINFQHLLTEDGLPQTQVRAVHQDPSGYIWVGTYGGAGRYNGRDFLTFDTTDGLASNTILTIESTVDGRVWMGTTNGLCWIDPGASRFECSKAPSIAKSAIQDLEPAVDGGLWVGTATGLFRVSLTTPDSVTAQYLHDKNVSSIKRDNTGSLWIATRSGLFQLPPRASAPRPVPLPADAGNVVLSIQPDSKYLWIGTENGLFLKRGENIGPSPGLPPEWTQDNINGMALSDSGDIWIATNQGVLRHTNDGFDLITETNGLISNITFTVFADREGVIWIGNDNGLTKYAPGPFVGYRKKHGLLHYFIRTLNEDARGHLWLGSRAGAQRVPYRDGEWRFEESMTLTEADGLADVRIYSIAFPKADEVLLATGDGVVHWREDEGVIRRYTMEDGLPTNATQALEIAPDGRVWIGTNLGVVILENGKIAPAPGELAQTYVFRIRLDAKDRLWFGSRDRGLFRLDGENLTRMMDTEDLTDKTIWDIAPDRHGGLWVGSNGDGLFHIASNGEIKQYTTADGLVDDFVWQVLVDDQDRVWTYTNAGISRLSDEQFKSYGTDDGLLHVEGGATGALQTHDGALWFASADGLMRYVPEFEYESTLPPPVLIEDVTVAGESIQQGDVLPHRPGLLDIQYAALSFEGVGEVEYRYRLLGAGEEWLTTEKYRPISFANLGAGQYSFQVTARKAGGDWNPQVARFDFRIDSPFWATTWFWVLVVVTIIALLWFAMRVKVQQARRRQRELAQTVEERTRELQQAAEELKSVNAQLESAAITDPLTGLLNRRYLTNQIATDVAQARRMHRGDNVFPNRDIVFLMIDLDYFKQVNDTYGHAAGDLVLREYSKIIKNEMRESDYVVRWGGEEFLVIARNTEASQCNVIAERIHNAGHKAVFTLDDGTELRVTCSIGVSHLPLFSDEPESVNWEHIIEVADSAVYMSKALGRNGWVSIRGINGANAPDAETLIRSIKTDLTRLVAERVVTVDSSFASPLEAAPDKPPRGPQTSSS